MSNLKVPRIINLYAPYTFDEEIEKFKNYEGNYVLDYRVKESTSQVALQANANYMAVGIPMAKLETPDNLLVYEETIPHKLPRVGTNPFNTRKYPNARPNDIIPHKTGLNDNYRSVHIDILVENLLTSLPDIAYGGKVYEKTPFSIAPLVINSVYLRVKGGRVTEHSPSLQKQLEDYRFKTGSSSVYLRDLFGSDRDASGIRGTFYYFNPSSASWVEHGVTLNSISVGTSVGVAQDGYVTLSSNDSSLASVWVDVMNVTPLTQSLEGGGKEDINTSLNTLPGGVRITNYNDGNRITGTGPVGKGITATFPDGREQAAVVEANGNWAISYPPPIKPDTPITEVDARKAKIRFTEDSATGADNTITKALDPVSVKSMGLPVLEATQGTTLSDAKPSYGYTTKRENLPAYATIRVGEPVVLDVESEEEKKAKEIASRFGFKNYTWTSSSKGTGNSSLQKFWILGARLTARVEGTSQFYSYSSAALQGVGMTMIVGIVFDKLIQPHPNDCYVSYEVAHVQFDKTKTTQHSIYPYFSTSWNRVYPVTRKITMRTSWVKDLRPKSLIYRTRWKVNPTKVTRSLRFSTRWVTHKPKTRSLQYSTRWLSNLPQKDTKRSFYIFTWDVFHKKTRSIQYSTKWITNLSRTRNREYKTSWITNLVEPVIAVPYYMKKLDIRTNKWIESVSYQVYGNKEAVQRAILLDRLYFFFSNPTKYELIRFNYNLLPYAGIILSDKNDKSMDDRTGVPESYEFIGNYTIEGISRFNSLSLDITAEDTQVNEARSYWIPEDIDTWPLTEFTKFSDGTDTYVWKIDPRFKEDLHEDVVDLDLIILNEEVCCFTQTGSGSRCSPY